MGQTVGAIASSLVKENVKSGIVEHVFRACDLLSWFMNSGRVLPIGGAYPYGWNINHTGNGSFEVFTEGQAAPPSGQQSYVRASISPFHGRVTVNLSGHLRDQIRNGGLHDDAGAAEFAKGTKDLYRGIEGQITGATQDRGIAAIIDASGIYAGIDAATVTSHSSLETNVAGALTLGVLETLFETMFQSPRGCEPDVIFTRENQVNNYVGLGGPGAGTNTVVRMDMAPTGDGRAIDLGLLKASHSYNGAVFTKIRDLVNTELYACTTGAPEDFCIREVRPIKVDNFGKKDDGEGAQISWAGLPVILNRRQQAKLTGLTA